MQLMISNQRTWNYQNPNNSSLDVFEKFYKTASLKWLNPEEKLLCVLDI